LAKSQRIQRRGAVATRLQPEQMREVARSAYDGEGAARAFIPAAIEAKMRERQQLKSRLEREKQFNRKVELNAALRSVSHELSELHHS